MEKKCATKFTWLLAIVFLAVGILGFVNNPIVGAEGYFKTDMNHNIVHIVTGVLAAVFAMNSEKAANMFLKVFGVIYLLVAIAGFFMLGDATDTMLLGLVHINAADNWLHLVLGVVILGVAWKTCPGCCKEKN